MTPSSVTWVIAMSFLIVSPQLLGFESPEDEHDGLYLRLPFRSLKHPACADQIFNGRRETCDLDLFTYPETHA